MRKFALCRICFRSLSLAGEIPGVCEVELVESGHRVRKKVGENDGSNCRHADAHPERVAGAAQESRHPRFEIEIEVARILKDEGYIANYTQSDNDGKPTLTVILKYGPEGEQVVTSIQRVSRPGYRFMSEAARSPGCSVAWESTFSVLPAV